MFERKTMNTINIDEEILSNEASKLLKKIINEGFEIAQIRNLPQNKVGDEIFSYLLFQICHGRNPTKEMIFNDILYNLKVSDEINDPLRVFISDKEYVKIFVKATIGDEYNVPTLGIINEIQDIEIYEFPDKSIIKPTHLSGKVILNTGQNQIDRAEIKKWFKINYYETWREKNYRTLRPKIIIEPILFNDINLNDYKFFCYKGIVKLIQVDLDRRTNHTRLFFDKKWNKKDFSIGYPISSQSPQKPLNLDHMISKVEVMAKYFEFIRIDLYSNEEKCYVGEITNCHGSGIEKVIPLNAEREFSNNIFK